MKNPRRNVSLAHGQCVQLFVFERWLNEGRFDALEARLHDEIDPAYDCLQMDLNSEERSRRVHMTGKALADEINETLAR